MLRIFSYDGLEWVSNWCLFRNGPIKSQYSTAPFWNPTWTAGRSESLSGTFWRLCLVINLLLPRRSNLIGGPMRSKNDNGPYCKSRIYHKIEQIIFVNTFELLGWWIIWEKFQDLLFCIFKNSFWMKSSILIGWKCSWSDFFTKARNWSSISLETVLK